MKRLEIFYINNDDNIVEFVPFIKVKTGIQRSQPKTTASSRENLYPLFWLSFQKSENSLSTCQFCLISVLSCIPSELLIRSDRFPTNCYHQIVCSTHDISWSLQNAVILFFNHSKKLQNSGREIHRFHLYKWDPMYHGYSFRCPPT